MSISGDGLNRRLLHLGLGLLVPLATLLAIAGPASAATFNVNTFNDSADASPCVSVCSLRDAVIAADDAGGPNTIVLQSGTYELTIGNPNSPEQDNPAKGDLDINNGVSVTITGQGETATIIDVNHIDRAFAVQSGGSLSISGVTIENGAQGPDTATDYPSESTGPEDGGAFYNDGSLSVDSSILRDNSAEEQGGVVYSDTAASSTSITNSTIIGNVTQEGPGGVADITAGSVTLSGDSITNNSADESGGVLSDEEGGHPAGPVTISDSTISDNSGSGGGPGGGGALDLDNAGSIDISGSTLDSNSTTSPGGALFDSDSGTITITGSTLSHDTSGDAPGGAVFATDTGAMSVGTSTFNGDSAGNGGALYIDDTNLAMTGSTFDGDDGSGGGAIYLEENSSNPTELPTQAITTSTFSGDLSANNPGGAIDDQGGNLSLTRSTFAGNSASFDGGAFYDDNEDALALTNDTFDGNQAVDGGAVYLGESAASDAPIVLLNDTIAHNSAYEGGGIYDPDNANAIENTIVADNSGGFTPAGGGDCYYNSTTDNAGAADKGGNIDSDGTCFSNVAPNDHAGVNPDLGSLAFNGGPTETDALLAGSPAIGDAVGGSCPGSDQRGVPRPAACDSGAFQTAPAAVTIAGSAPPAATIGGPITYTFTITNNGPASATGVSVSDALPAGTSFFGSSSSQGSCSGTSTVTCAIGTLDSSNTSASGSPGSASVTITLIPSRAGEVTNSATVSANNSANNTVSKTTAVTGGAALSGHVAPVVLTGLASQITKTGAKLSGLVNPAGARTTYSFELGTSTRHEKSVKGGTVNGSTVKVVLVKVKGLKPGTTYDFKIVARNASGTSSGQNEKFKTPKKR